jgi:subtilase family serine protease
MSRIIRARRVVIAGTAALALAAGGIAAGSAAMASGRNAIPGTHPAWARAAHGNAPQAVTNGTVNARVYLAGRDPSGLQSYARAASTPGNALYRHFLSPAQVQAKFGPSQQQITALSSWLTAAGMRVTGESDHVGGFLSVSGPVAAAAKTFGVTFGTFKGPDGRMDRAPEQDATIPAAVAGSVLTVAGLDTASHNMKPADKLPPPGPNYWVAPPTGNYYDQLTAANEPTAYGKHQPWNVRGYTPSQVRSAYGVASSKMTGAGQTVAIVDAYASPTMPSDANQYARVTGDKPFRAGQYQQFLAKKFTDTAANQCDAPGWYGEETLDIQQVHGEAPDANIRYVGAANCTDAGLGDALAYIVDNHLASIVSDSFGEPDDSETMAAVYDQIFQAGAAEGIGFFFSSGDSGYESPQEDPGSDKIQVDYPTSSPWVTSVGGTSLAIGSRSNYEFETSWGTMQEPLASDGKSWSSTPPGPYPASYDGSSGGGASTRYQQPSYQAGVVPASLAEHLPDGTTSSTPMRVEPDVSALADPSTGVLVGQTTLQPDGKSFAFSLSRIGGTSVACPVFAGIEADAQQAAGGPLGFANPMIYMRHGSSAFRDVTDTPFGPGVHLAQVRNNYTDPSTKGGPIVTNLRTLGIDGEGAAALPAIRGYDDATGIGSPRSYIQSFQR